MDVFDCNRATNCYSNYTKGYYGKLEYVLPTLLISAVVISVHEYVPTHKKEIDDFGMERGTEYALEQVYNIVDSRYRSQKPLIVTTNLPLNEIRHPQDTAHARIYDRILEMCVPISCIGASLRKENAQKKLESMKSLIG